MIAGLLLSLIAGLLARFAFRRGRPGIVAAMLAGMVGAVFGSPVVHQISGEHEFHAFRPESFIAAIGGAIVLLWIHRRVRERGHPGDRRLFS